MANAIELSGITKTFGDIVANKNIHLSAKQGEILALLGENGSGKTTLMNILSGIYKPDSGEIFINGEKVSIQSPEDAKHLGIGMVHQHFKLVENFSAADNIWLGSEKDDEFLLPKERYKKIHDFSQKFGFEIDPHKKICDMSVGEKQTVEILKILYYGAKILILDEPTAVLTPQEIEKLFDVFRAMRDSGCSVIIITHKLHEVLELSDRVTVLRKGESVATVNTAETDEKKLTELMVGRPIELSIERPECTMDETLLNVHHLTVENEEGIEALRDVSFDLQRGEILGVAGIAGSGQKELCEAIAGLQPIRKGAILYKKENIEGKSPREIISLGISMSFIPEDRLGMGLAASLDIADNMLIKNYVDSKTPFVDRKGAENLATRLVDELDIVTPGIHTPVRRLSGGNVQKVLLGREVAASPNLLIAAYAVRGLDINSSYTIYDMLNQQKQRGVGVLFIGEDLDVMLKLCDRIMVLCHGKVTGIVNAKDVTKEEIGLLMADAYGKEEKTEEKHERKVFVPPVEEIKQDIKAQKKKREPLFRMSKRADLSVAKSTLYYVYAVLLALIMGGVFIAATGVNPLSYYGTVLVGCFNNAIYLKGYLSLIPPLLITSLGIAMAFKMRFWNIGANGQFIMGAILATWVGHMLANSAPQWLTLLLMLIAGIIGGGLYAFIPAFFKMKFNTNETLLTLMLNYVAIYTLSFLKTTMFFRKVSETGQVFRPDFKALAENGWLYSLKIGNVPVDISLIVAIVLTALLFVYFKKTKQGYEVAVVGDSPNTARYGGMDVKKIVFRTIFLSGALIGAAAMFQVSGAATGHTLNEGITNDVGWTGITVAWLAKLNPIGIFITSVLMCMLQKGTAVAESTYNISSAASSVLQGIILFTVLAADFFTRYKIVSGRNGGERK